MSHFPIPDPVMMKRILINQKYSKWKKNKFTASQTNISSTFHQHFNISFRVSYKEYLSKKIFNCLDCCGKVIVSSGGSANQVGIFVNSPFTQDLKEKFTSFCQWSRSNSALWDHKASLDPNYGRRGSQIKKSEDGRWKIEKDKSGP